MITLPPVYYASVPVVPFYSQFTDIHSSSWQKVGCGITSLAMVVDYYSSDTISVDTMLKQGISSGAYDHTYGWIHNGLINVSKKYGMNGKSYDVTKQTRDASFNTLESFLSDGPIIASVHYKFDPRSSVPHLVVIDGVKNGYVYYNDPAAAVGQKKILISDFEKGWKKKFIVIRPDKQKVSVV